MSAEQFVGAVVDGARMLTETEVMTLDLERTWWKYAGAKEAKVRELFAESSTRYYQRLNALIDRSEALAHDPLVVRRLLRLREARTRARRPAAVEA